MLLHTHELSLVSSEYILQIKIKTTFSWLERIGSFCEPNFQFAAILHKKSKIIIFITFQLLSFFFQKYFTLQCWTWSWFCIDIEFVKLFLNVQKVTMTWKISALKRKSYFNLSTFNGISSDPYAFLKVIFLKKVFIFPAVANLNLIFSSRKMLLLIIKIQGWFLYF